MRTHRLICKVEPRTCHAPAMASSSARTGRRLSSRTAAAADRFIVSTAKGKASGSSDMVTTAPPCAALLIAMPRTTGSVAPSRPSNGLPVAKARMAVVNAASSPRAGAALSNRPSSPARAVVVVRERRARRSTYVREKVSK